MNPVILAKGYNILHLNALYDLSSKTYVEYGSDDIYPISLRIVRFALSDGSYECIVTNLPQETFSPE
ncbi:hypothetical protein [Lacrimispora brassicae]